MRGFPCRKCFAVGRKWKWHFRRLFSGFVWDQRGRVWGRGTASQKQLVGWARHHKIKSLQAGKLFPVCPPTHLVLILKFSVINSARTGGIKTSWGKGWKCPFSGWWVWWPLAALGVPRRGCNNSPQCFVWSSASLQTPNYPPKDLYPWWGGVLASWWDPPVSGAHKKENLCEAKKIVKEGPFLSQVENRDRRTAWKLKSASFY